MESLYKQLDVLTTKVDEIFTTMEDETAYADPQDFMDNAGDVLNSAIGTLEFLGGRVIGMNYLPKAIWLGYDIPLAMDCIHDEIWPILDQQFERIEYEGDIMHVIRGELDAQFVQGIISAFTYKYRMEEDLDDEFNITYEIVTIHAEDEVTE